MKRRHLFVLISSLIVLFIGIIFVFNYSLKSSVHTVTTESNTYSGSSSFDFGELERVEINNLHGNTLIQHVETDVISIKTSEGNETPYQVYKDEETFCLEVMYEENTDSSLNLTIELPQSLKQINTKSRFGNIRADLAETDHVDFETYFGNIITTFEIVNPEGKYFFLTNLGNIYTIVPDNTEVKSVNPGGESFFFGATETRSGVEMYAHARDVHLSPVHFIGKSQLGHPFRTEEIPTLTLEQKQDDLNQFIRVLRSNHPTVITNYEEFKPLFEAVQERVKQIETTEEFYFLLNELLVATRDGHTFFYSGLKNEDVDLPYLKWTSENELIFVMDEGEFQTGDKILAVGGMNAEDLFEAAKTLIPAEHDGRIEALLSHSFIHQGKYLRYLGLVDDSDHVEILVDRNGEELSFLLPIKYNTTHNDKINDLFDTNVQNPYRFSIDELNNFGLIEMSQFIWTELYEEMLKDFFEDVKENNIEHIVIDVRGNPGGNSQVIMELFRYIDVDFDSNRPKYEELLFMGNFYVLTNSNSFSASTMLATNLKYNIGATLIGETPGNNIVFTGDGQLFPLENSNFVAFIPTSLFHVRGVPLEEQHQPLKMDYPIEVTREAIINGEDPWMEKVREILQ